MKQITCAVSDSFDAIKLLEDVKKSSDYQNAENVLVNIFTKRIQKDYISYISDLILSGLPKAKISGLTCLEGFSLCENTAASTVITILCFQVSEVKVIEYDFSKISVNDAKKSFVEELRNFSN